MADSSVLEDPKLDPVQSEEPARAQDPIIEDVESAKIPEIEPSLQASTHALDQPSDIKPADDPIKGTEVTNSDSIVPDSENTLVVAVASDTPAASDASDAPDASVALEASVTLDASALNVPVGAPIDALVDSPAALHVPNVPDAPVDVPVATLDAPVILDIPLASDAPVEATTTPIPIEKDVDPIESTEQTHISPIHDPPITAKEQTKDDESIIVKSDQNAQIDRNSYIQKIKEVLTARESYTAINVQLQHKLGEVFRKRRAEEKGVEVDKVVTDQDQRYASLITNLYSLRKEYKDTEKANSKLAEELKAKLEERKLEITKKSEEFRKYKRQIAASAENSRTGKPIPIKIIDQMDSLETKKDQDVAAVRLENIKLRNKLKRHEQALRLKEELAEGLHLIDFEQLKIENQAFNEKIEERNEELMKLRKKITNIVQVLAHIKEKLQFVQKENRDLRQELKTLDVQVTMERDQLPQNKYKRDVLRTKNVYLKEKNGLLGNVELLRDYEVQYDQVQALQQEIDRLQQIYSAIAADQASLSKSNTTLPRLQAR